MMTSKTLNRWLFLFALAVVAASPAKGQWGTPLTELDAPKKNYSIKFLSKPLPGADDSDNATIQVTAGNRVLSQYSTYGFLINALWSPDEKYVAVNNRRANSGDYLWVFSLKSGGALKKPDDASYDTILDQAVKRFPQFSSYKDGRVFILATGWNNAEELSVRTRVLLGGNFGSVTAVEIFINDIYQCKNNKLRVKRMDIEISEHQNLGYWPSLRAP